MIILLISAITAIIKQNLLETKKQKKKKWSTVLYNQRLKYFLIHSVTGTISLSLLPTVVNTNKKTQFLDLTEANTEADMAIKAEKSQVVKSLKDRKVNN